MICFIARAAVIAALIYFPIRCSADEAVFDPEKILTNVRAALPGDPLKITGELRLIKRKGFIIRKHPVKLSVDFDRNGGSAQLIIIDPRTDRKDQLKIRYSTGGSGSCFLKKGQGEWESSVGTLFKQIQDTNVSWADLALYFLWWDQDEFIGIDSVKGRECYVVVVSPSPITDATLKEDQDVTGSAVYRRVKLWIDSKAFMVLRAEGYDGKGDLMRRLTVRSLKKINERWMIKEMEIESPPFLFRTRFHVDDMEVNED